MKNIFLPVIIFSLFLFAGCGSASRIYSDIDDTGRFEHYSTYNFMDFTDGNKKTIPETELEQIRIAFARELEQNGLQFVKENGDVSIKITVFHRQAMDGYYRHHRRNTIMERAISIDMYDNQSMTHVWHCAAIDELEYDAKERAELFSVVASKIFDKYPIKSSDQI